MAVTDPVDIRLLAALADLGKAAVHELAAKVGMDPREVAYRLVALSGSGLPLLVGVESDPNGLRSAIAGAPPSWAQQPQQPQQPPQRPPGHSGPHNIQGTPSGPYNVQGTPSGAYNVHGTPSGRYPGPPSAPVRQPMAPPQPPPRPPAPPQQQFAPPPMAPADPVMSTWGVPQTASWARGDEQQVTPQAAPEGKKGRTGDVMETQGLEGEQLTVQLLEVQDPADYLFSAAGYSLEAGERSVVVHTEITNRGNIPFVSLPDNYLELLTADGKPIAKAPVSLTSRPPHKIGVRPGETLGGHTVYVLPDATRVVAVRWSPRPEPDERTLTWSIED
ncbi:AsnC family protein [Amycolatopsis sp. EV170708-02-1]|uniref:AsnC family protein n=1 Tax=Amycolatopsis sp. EV170708-02-1 TaxID=2919322 RepID=UPI001F0C2A3F|nr:AsnC family protein [Amycolatopsis sp. EV170708-02-1]UMP00187.1 AsnC family protein [Amycolatopsis sp. EV170708-02-1]